MSLLTTELNGVFLRVTPQNNQWDYDSVNCEATRKSGEMNFKMIDS
jgi:hypothetical protein